jgi:hypothetical protein
MGLDIGRGRTITHEAISVNELHNITVWQGEREIGRLFMVTPPERSDAVLLDVYVYWPEDRRKGYASDLLKYAKNKFPNIITGYRSRPGLNLCLKNGFKLIRPMFQKQKAFLTFEKEEK